MYHFVSSFGMVLSVLVLTVMLLVRNRALRNPPGEHIFNYLAQLMLAFTILWVYTFFAQYLIIWYANLPDETGRLFQLQNGPFSALFWTFFIMKFVIPFSVLLFPYSRHTRGVIAFVAASIIIGYWIERFTWIAGAAPGSPSGAFSPFAIGVSIVIFASAYFLVRGAMNKYGLLNGKGFYGVAVRGQID
jgi:Ni/Fe-hydrogenase subunit HybB-like protein